MNRAALPVYVQIANELRKNIEQGIYQRGDKLPTEAQLSERFSVNRHTLRRAIALLRDEGLLRVDRGRGTFVAAKPIRYAIGKRVRYNDALTAQGFVANFKLLKTIEIPADKAIAVALELKVGEPVAVIERLGFADSQPISLSTSHFPLYRFRNILEPRAIEYLLRQQSISKLLREMYDCDHLRRSTSIFACLVKSQDARLLEVPFNHPILLAESVNVDQEGRVIEYTVSRFRGDRMELVFENQLP